MSRPLPEMLRERLDSHGTRQLLGLPDDEFDCCVRELAQTVAAWLGEQRETVANGLHEAIDGDFLIGCPDGDIPIRSAGAKDVVWWAAAAALAALVDAARGGS